MSTGHAYESQNLVSFYWICICGFMTAWLSCVRSAERLPSEKNLEHLETADALREHAPMC